MAVLDCLKPLTLSAVGNDDRMLRNKIFDIFVSSFVVCKCPGDRDTINCQMSGPRDSPCIKCPGWDRMLAAGIDWHIRLWFSGRSGLEKGI